MRTLKVLRAIQQGAQNTDEIAKAVPCTRQQACVAVQTLRRSGFIITAEIHCNLGPRLAILSA